MSDPFIAEIKMFGGNFAPQGYAFCNGQVLSISQNQALFSLVGTIYGGDGRTSFGLPDLRGRTPVHPGSGAGLSTVSLGQKGGIETHTLAETEMPSHTHSVSDLKSKGTAQTGDSNSPAGNVPGAMTAAQPYSSGTANADMNDSALGGNLTADNAGSGLPFLLRDPYLAITFIIALTGIFPSQS